jgi:hypothetical protein
MEDKFDWLHSEQGSNSFSHIHRVNPNSLEFHVYISRERLVEEYKGFQVWGIDGEIWYILHPGGAKTIHFSPIQSFDLKLFVNKLEEFEQLLNEYISNI